jgi:hypothetical protein
MSACSKNSGCSITLKYKQKSTHAKCNGKPHIAALSSSACFSIISLRIEGLAGGKSFSLQTESKTFLSSVFFLSLSSVPIVNNRVVKIMEPNIAMSNTAPAIKKGKYQ